jgi:hypothetical protein
MSWKDRLQVRDLEEDRRLEVTCRTCGDMHYLTRARLLAIKGAADLYISEVEKRTCCKKYGCWGRVRIAMPRTGDASAFVGGLA